ncbi:MAG: trypsin-like peptidase domain-containing protein [Candidatus Dormibacteria bacterium]
MNDDTTPPLDPDQTGSGSPSSDPDPSAAGGEPAEPGGAPGWGWGGQQRGPGTTGAPGWGQPWGPPPGAYGSAYGWTNDPWAGYPPYGPAAAYPPPPPALTDYPPAAPRKPARLAPVAIAVAVVIALASGVTGAGIGIALRSSPSSSSTSGGSSTGGQSPSTSSPSTSTSGGSSVNAAAIAAAIDPSVVDVITTLPDDQGLAEGTGIIISTSGLVLTNNHVIDDAQSVTVQIDGQGPQLASKVLGYDPVDDVALIQIDSTSGLSLKVAPLGNSDSVSVGDSVVAIGNAYGRSGTPAVVTGTVTGLDQSITASDGGSSENLTGMIQMDADIVSGDSGGPLVNAAGKVIGLDTAGSTTGASFGGQTGSTQGFAVPIDTALQVAQQIESGQSSGSINVGPGPYIGVEVSDSDTASGALIDQVEPNTPASSAGLQAGDVITSVNGNQITDSADLSSALEDLHPGDTIQLGWVDSSGQQHTSSITLGSGLPR